MPPPTDQKRLVTGCYVAISLSLGLALVILLGLWGGFGFRDFSAALTQIHPFFGGLMVVSTFFHFWVTATKWRLITEQIVDGVSLRCGFFYYTVLAGLFSQMLPQQLCTVMVRVLALRHHEALHLRKGALSTLFDQSFDLLIPAVLLAPSLLVVLGKLSLGMGLSLVLALLVVFGVGVVLLAKRVLIIERWMKRHGFRPRQDSSRITNYPTRFEALSLLSDSVVIRLYALSVLRYVNLMCRALLVVPAAGLDIPLAYVAYGFAPVLLSAVISITPANIGIAEWGWVGMLKLGGLSPTTAIHYALLNRGLTFFAVISVNAIVFASLLCMRYRQIFFAEERHQTT